MCLRVLLRAASREACVKICSPTVTRIVPGPGGRGTPREVEVFSRMQRRSGWGLRASFHIRYVHSLEA